MSPNQQVSFGDVLTKYLKPEDLAKIRSLKVGIAGAGGLGSNCAMSLVRSGFSQLVIVDFDLVEASNLNRQFYFLDQIGRPKVEALKENLMRINPELQIEAVQEKLETERMREIFAYCDAVVEAFDNPIYKRKLVETFMTTGKLVVSASGLAGIGNSDQIKVRRIKDNFYLVGDLETAVRHDQPPLSPRVNVAAAKQADVVLGWALGRLSMSEQ